MRKYIFVSNGTKPTKEEAESRENIKITNYSRPCLEAAQELGYEVILGVNRKKASELKSDMEGITFYDQHSYRNPLDIISNYIAYRNLKDIVSEGDVEVIHCNTAVGSLVARIVAKKYKIATVIHTAHGFLFYEGAPLINRTLYRWEEKLLSRWTDVVLTINDEDYKAAQSLKLKKNGKVYKISGVGIDVKQFQNIKVDRQRYRRSFGIEENATICISVGDLNRNKNNRLVIEAIKEIEDKNIHYLICGRGPELSKLKKLVHKYALDGNVHFLGFREDIGNLLKVSDIFINVSYREGLPRATMEAMASGIPCVVSNIRGNRDLIENGIGGYTVSPNDKIELAKSILLVRKNPELSANMVRYNLEKIKNYDVSEVKKQISRIYKDRLKGRSSTD